MIPRILWNALRKNISLVLMLVAVACPILALDKTMPGATLLIPIALVAVLCGWWAGRSRINGRQAAGWLVALGLPGVFIYIVRLAVPLWNLLLSVYSIILQVFRWVGSRAPIDPAPLLVVWSDLSSRVAVALLRLWGWVVSFVSGKPAVDSAAAGLAWSILFWLIGIWAGWQFRRKRLAIHALVPGGIVLALVLDYTRWGTDLVVLYLILMLSLAGLAHYEDLLAGWLQRGVDYSESIAIDSVTLAAPVVILLVGAAMLTPSLSWEDLVDRFRDPDRRQDGQVAESAKWDVPPNVAHDEAYRSNGMPRLMLLSAPPEQLETVVMTISTGENPPPSGHYYWRTRTYDRYTGVGWSSRPAREVSLVANTPLLKSLSTYRVVHQQVERASDQDKSLYWAGTLVQADTDIKIAWRVYPPSDPDPLNKGDMLGAVIDASAYTVESYVPQVSKMQLKAAERDYPLEIVSRYLELPTDTPNRVLTLAQELTGAEPTLYDQALAIESYLRKIPYTLKVEPPPFDQNVVDYFLFTAQEGYCDYYASSMVVLARAAGLPARIVVGYATGDYDSSTGQYTVRQKHAHTWVEIYFAEIGWVEFEPTGSQPSISYAEDESESQPDGNLHLDKLAISWLKEQWQTLISTMVGQALFASAILIGLIILWQTGVNIYFRLLPPALAIQRIYARIDKAAIHLLPNLSGGHTPLGLKTALSNKFKETNNGLLRIAFRRAPLEIEQLATLYMTQTFSQHPLSRLQVRKGIKIWFRLRWKLWLARVIM